MDYIKQEVLIPIKIIKRGSAKSKVLKKQGEKGINKPLRKALIKAHKWDNDMMSLRDSDRYIIRQNLSRRYVQRLMKLTCLSPKIQKAIMDGTFPQNILLQDILYKDCGLLWYEQEQQLLENK